MFKKRSSKYKSLMSKLLHSTLNLWHTTVTIMLTPGLYLLSTITIRPDDMVTKYVCQHCSDIAISLYKYRKKAIANDKVLKEIAKQNFPVSCTKTKDILELNRSTLDELIKEEEDIKVREVKSPILKKSITPNLAVHPTVIQLIKQYPKLKIPNDTLKCNIQPSIVLNRSEVENWKLSPTLVKIESAPDEISAVKRFKLMCPGINITKVVSQTTAVENRSIVNPTSKMLVEKEMSKSPDLSKRKRRNSSTSSDKSAKKRRSQTPSISSTSGIKQIPKLVINLRKSSLQPPPIQETCNKLPSPSTSTLGPTGDIHIRRTSTISTVAVAADIDNYSESDMEDIIPKKSKKRKPKSTSDTDDSDYQPDADEVSNPSDSLLDTIDEEIVINCGTCNKMFNTRQQLRNHERVHRQCTICNGIFRTNEILRYHQQEICFKRIIANSPKLELTRVDEIPAVVKAYPSAFNPELQDAFEIQPRKENTAVISDDDDDVILIEDNRNTTNAQNPISNGPEYKHICEIFQKYKKLRVPDAKHKSTETKPRMNVKYNDKDQIILEYMYPELQRYRVPVELIAKPTSFAYITFSKKQAKPKDIYCWVNEPVIGLVENKGLSLTALLNSQPSVNCQKNMTTPAWTRTNASVPTSTEVNSATASVRLQQDLSTSKGVIKQSISYDKTKTNPSPSTSGRSKDTGFSLRIKTPSELNTY